MYWTKHFLKIICINIGLTLFLMGLLIIIPALWGDIQNLFERKFKTSSSQQYSRANLPSYEKEPWVKEHFFELKTLHTQYYDFIGWRRKPFSGKTVTIDQDGFRRHSSKANGPEDSEIWVFGGSTIWGTGSPDNLTIPAMLEKFSGKSTFNFGESGYVAHQSLNLLMRQYVVGGKPKTVIFYDGVNEVSHKCRSELGFYSSSQERKIREKIEYDGSRFFSLFNPLIKNIASLTNKGGKDWYDCHTNIEKSNLIVKNWVQDWLIAKNLVESHGGKFIAVLQPVSYIGNPNMNYLPIKDKDPMMKAQFESIYPRVKEELRAQGVEYYDLTDSFNSKEKVYIDFCHVSPEGNQKIAKMIAGII